jgi:hypothetical protein
MTPTIIRRRVLGTIIVSTLAFSTLTLVALTASAQKPPRARTTAGGGQLEIISATREQIRGRLTNGDIGVVFNSRKQGPASFWRSGHWTVANSSR